MKKQEKDKKKKKRNYGREFLSIFPSINDKDPVGFVAFWTVIVVILITLIR